MDIMMNERIKELVQHAVLAVDIVTGNESLDDELAKMYIPDCFAEKFAELIVESVLDQVKERAYYTGDRDWSDEVDRPWIQLEFGYGALHDAKTSRS